LLVRWDVSLFASSRRLVETGFRDLAEPTTFLRWFDRTEERVVTCFFELMTKLSADQRTYPEETVKESRQEIHAP